MTKKTFAISLGAAAATLLAAAQQSDIIIKLTQGEKTAIAVPDLRGSGEAQQFMGAFNQTLWNDLETSGLFKMVSKSLYPTQIPQTPQDFRPPVMPQGRVRRGAPPPQPVYQGPWLTQWSGPPVNAGYLAFGYTAADNGQIVLRGWLFT